MSINDAIGEGPHAQVGGIIKKAPSGRWPFYASTLRLNEAIEDMQWMPRASGTDPGAAWGGFKHVVKTSDEH